MCHRFYQPTSLVAGVTLYLTKKASHHLAHVLRAKAGQKIRLFNGKDMGEYDATIVGINKNGIEVQIEQFLPVNRESSLDISLAQGCARGEKMDYIIQKATELGVTQIVPLQTARSLKLSKETADKRWQHWCSIAISACEQSGRCQVPKISSLIDFDQWINKQTAINSFVFSPHIPSQQIKSLTPNLPVVLLLGSEGGLTEEETKMAIAKGLSPTCLGPRILRTETATIATVSIFQANYGDMGSENS